MLLPITNNRRPAQSPLRFSIKVQIQRLKRRHRNSNRVVARKVKAKIRFFAMLMIYSHNFYSVTESIPEQRVSPVILMTPSAFS
jgi:hypothetical protein